MKKPTVFISYSHADNQFVDQFAEKLTAIGVHIWIDKWMIKVGDSITGKINEGIGASDFLIVVLSRASVNSKWVREELNAATIRNIEQEKRAFILPVLIEECEIPPLLRDKKYANFKDDPQQAFQELREIIAPPPVSTRPAAILVGSFASWWGDETFKYFENPLTNELGFEVVRFSYNGLEFPSYTKFDTVKPLRDLCDYFDDYISRYPRHEDQVPLFVLAHSLGGLIVANWICQPDPFPGLSQINKIFLFSSPVIPYPGLTVPVQYKGYSLALDITPYYVTRSRLLHRFHKIVVLRGTRDPIAPKNVAWLGDPDPERGPLYDKEFDVTHAMIAGDKEVARFVLNMIRRNLEQEGERVYSSGSL